MGWFVDLLEALVGKAQEYKEDIESRQEKYKNLDDAQLAKRVKSQQGREKMAAAWELKQRKESSED